MTTTYTIQGLDEITTDPIEGLDEIDEAEEAVTCWTCGAVLDYPEDGYCSRPCHAEAMHELRQGGYR